jgi:hypothetical protein
LVFGTRVERFPAEYSTAHHACFTQDQRDGPSVDARYSYDTVVDQIVFEGSGGSEI